MDRQLLKPWARTRNALGPTDFLALCDGLLGSPLLDRSTLGGTFEQTRGFAITFHGEGRARLEARFPFVAPFLELAIDRHGPRRLRPWCRPGLEVAQPNAWYLNVLLVGAQGRVGRHVDATLQGPAEVPGATPEVVSVLYLQVPRGSGGALVLHDGPREVARLQPRERTLLHFRGDLAHEVTALADEPMALRASLVLEQYAFAPEALARLGPFQLDSRAGFEVFLAQHQAGPKATFTLD